MNATPPAPLKIALLGFGTVGSGVAQILTSQSDLVTRQANREICISHVLVRDADKPRPGLPENCRLTTSIDEILDDPQVSVVVELMGGVTPALDYISRSLKAGRHIVTANKALLYEHGVDLFQKANRAGCTIGFEAAVAGGIPIVGCLTQSLTANRILSIEAILNGTSNFILTHMLHDSQPYDEVLAEAQRLGYAEADPAMDVDGTDAAQKLSLLTWLAWGNPVRLSEFVRQGIDNVQLQDLQVAARLGYKIKLLAVSRLHDGRLEVSVQPTLIRTHRPIAQIDGADNIVAVTGSAIGKATFSGAGAGQLPTASAVVADIIDFATGRTEATFAAIQRTISQSSAELQPQEELCRRYYLRMTVDDRPHVLADITDVLGRHEISISSVHQDETPEADQAETGLANLVIMTHRTTEGRLRAVDDEFSRLQCLHGPWIRLPVAD